ncbi:hypothetical protein B0H12DRAFT_1224961 [Mycena haematopus]|nr:hypothetical protein B0H12DRAFT_1224961 [Mycena haematopus]
MGPAFALRFHQTRRHPLRLRRRPGTLLYNTVRVPSQLFLLFDPFDASESPACGIGWDGDASTSWNASPRPAVVSATFRPRTSSTRRFFYLRTGPQPLRCVTIALRCVPLLHAYATPHRATLCCPRCATHPPPRLHYACVRYVVPATLQPDDAARPPLVHAALHLFPRTSTRNRIDPTNARLRLRPAPIKRRSFALRGTLTYDCRTREMRTRESNARTRREMMTNAGNVPGRTRRGRMRETNARETNERAGDDDKRARALDDERTRNRRTRKTRTRTRQVRISSLSFVSRRHDSPTYLSYTRNESIEHERARRQYAREARTLDVCGKTHLRVRSFVGTHRGTVEPHRPRRPRHALGERRDPPDARVSSEESGARRAREIQPRARDPSCARMTPA